MIAGKTSRLVGGASRARNGAGATGVMACLSSLLVAVLWLAAPALAQEKPLRIGVLALGPRAVPAWQCGQQAGQPRRHDTLPPYVPGLLDGLRKLKYVEVGPDGKPKEALPPGAGSGRRFFLDLRFGTREQLKAAARDLAEKRVDIIVAVATLAVRIAQQETKGSNIPILMTGVSEPVKEGFVELLARPGGDITGVSHQLVQGSGKRVELFKEMLPNLQRLISIRFPGYSVSEKSMPEIHEAADRLGIEVADRTVKSPQDLQAELANLPGDNAGLLIAPDFFIISHLDMVLEASLARRVPAFGLMDYMSDWGAIAAYGPSAYQAGVHVSKYVDRINKGVKPGDMPVEPIDPTYVINLKAAQCLGMSVPLQVLQQADRVIQ